MDLGHLIGISLLLGGLFLAIQRVEAKKRIFVIVLMCGVFILIRNWIVLRGAEREGWAGLFIALLLNFLFWVFIGRYNPVGSSDEIKVLGLDD